MDAVATIALIDKLVGALTGMLNLFGTTKVVSDIIAKRIAEGGRDWTDAERQAVLDDLAANKKYAADQLGLQLDTSPPAPGGTPKA
jgi:hypothetical protein